MANQNKSQKKADADTPNPLGNSQLPPLKKGDKGGSKTPPQPPSLKGGKVTRRREPPSLLYPILSFPAIASAAAFANWIGFVGRDTTFWIVGLCSLLLFLSIPIFVNFLTLNNKRVIVLVSTASLLTAISFLAEFNRVADFGPELLSGELSEINRSLNLDINPNAYWAVFFGHFRPGKLGSEATGKYTIKLTSGEKDLKEYSDQFQIIHKRRKMARRAYGYQEYQNLTERFKIKLEEGKANSLFLSYIDPKLEKIEVKLYKLSSILFWIGIAFAIIALVAASEVDSLIKAAKYPGFFAFSFGAALGFTFYYGTEALPDSEIGALAFDILVGGIFGMVIGGAFFYALNPFLTKLNRKLKLLISR